MPKDAGNKNQHLSNPAWPVEDVEYQRRWEAISTNGNTALHYKVLDEMDAAIAEHERRIANLNAARREYINRHALNK